MTHNNVVLTESSSRRKSMRSQTHIYTSGTQINTACKHPGDAQASCIQCNGQSVLLTVSYLLTVYIYMDCLWVNIYDKAISQFHFNNFIYHIFSQVQFTQELQLGSLNSLLAELNIPTVHYKTINARLKETGKMVEKIAIDSTDEALQNEIKAVEQYVDA